MKKKCRFMFFKYLVLIRYHCCTSQDTHQTTFNIRGLSHASGRQSSGVFAETTCWC